MSGKESITGFQKQREDILENSKKKIDKIKPLAEHLSHLADQIADIERFRTYISWIQKLEAVRYMMNTCIVYKICSHDVWELQSGYNMAANAA